ncbi:diguanylate cyclase domain-containing protein [Duganella sp. BuS-21]|uniref:diguanylate cyclase domain-containing protein n=1 Tax=Duganella sp. BuS-21 TaxID=2943848 RepID=UPI0035A72245
MHKLLARQLAKVDLDSAAGLPALLELVGNAYTEHDQERRRSDRSTGLMAEELDELYAQLQQSMALIAQQNLRFQAALDNMSQSLCLFDRDGRLVVCNRRFLQLYRLPDSYQPIGQPLAAILEHSAALAQLAPADAAQRRAAHVALALGAALEQHWAGEQVVAIARNRIDDGGYLDTMADITASHQATARILHMARYDALTDLPNRTLYRERLLNVVEHARRGELCAVFCLDLDRFKAVNDNFGHPVGDALLVEVSARLKACVREVDTVARLGGDEFAILLRQLVSAEQTHGLAERIIHDLCQPYELDGHLVSIGASIGIAIVNRTHNDPETLMCYADQALYQAKHAGRGVFRQYLP